ncbi:hypothetical protein IFM89_022972 [Coptis chinensis]|uniref:Magnesium transporter n=1 Tax=Coptis chinensis TaxID=261450 RepID=A0A835H267_9MAGN|nr:hypothetical protein IFM89_022972 [Coptis chinensis]
MERVCALPTDVIHQVVELALQLLQCPQDQARKNAAVFFAAAFVFKAVLDAFDAQEGLEKVLILLHGAASVRFGGNSGTLALSNPGLLRNDRSSSELLTASEKQVAYHTCVALRQFFRAHLLLLVDSIRPNKTHRSIARNISSARAAYKPLDISNEAIDAVFVQIQRDRKLGPAFVRTRWPAVDKFLSCNGHIILLELSQAPPAERYLHDLVQYPIMCPAVLAHIILRERLHIFGVLGCVLCVVGSTTIVLHAPQEQMIESVAEVWDLATEAGFLLYAALVIVAVFILIVRVIPHYGQTHIMVYVGVMSVKALGIALKLTFSGTNQLIFPQMWALDTFNTAVVSPIYYVMFTMLTILASVIMFKDWDRQNATQIVTEMCGFLTILSGTFLLHKTNNMADGMPGRIPKHIDEEDDFTSEGIPLRCQESLRS